MKGKIDKKGRLWIERGGELKLAFCPHTSAASLFRRKHGVIVCGDWCAKFNEPEVQIAGVDLEICSGVRWFASFTDERAKDD